jgi:sulfhydrogenase subunit beta (sulfur reductase)
MSAGFLSHDALRRWLGALMNDQPLIAPVRQGRRVVFAPVDDLSDIVWEAGRTSRSPSALLDPTSGPVHVAPTPGSPTWPGARTPSSPRVLFGIRPCDARALAAAHRLAAADPADVLSTARRDRTSLVGVACGDGPWQGCFCTSSGGDPEDRSHVDVLLIPAPGGFAVDPVTSRGWALLGSAPLAPLGPAALPRARPAPVHLPSAAALQASHGDPIWAEIESRCTDCGTCDEDCPIGPGLGLRPSSAPLEAPRDTGWASTGPPARGGIPGRLRYFVVGPGQILCVGCGRCVVSCTAGIDVREVLARLSSKDRAPDNDR